MQFPFTLSQVSVRSAEQPFLPNYNTFPASGPFLLEHPLGRGHASRSRFLSNRFYTPSHAHWLMTIRNVLDNLAINWKISIPDVIFNLFITVC